MRGTIVSAIIGLIIFIIWLNIMLSSEFLVRTWGGFFKCLDMRLLGFIICKV